MHLALKNPETQSHVGQWLQAKNIYIFYVNIHQKFEMEHSHSLQFFCSWQNEM